MTGPGREWASGNNVCVREGRERAGPVLPMPVGLSVSCPRGALDLGRPLTLIPAEARRLGPGAPAFTRNPGLQATPREDVTRGGAVPLGQGQSWRGTQV